MAELEYALNKVECRALITADQFKSSDDIGMLRAARLPHLTTLIHRGNSDEAGCYRFEVVAQLGGAVALGLALSEHPPPGR